MSLAARNPWIIVAICHAFAILVAAEINYYLAPTSLYIVISGALIAFSALKLSETQGALSILPIAIYFDSKAPLPFGSIALLMLGLHYALALLKRRFKRETNEILLVTALVANVVVHVLYSLVVAAHFGLEQWAPLHTAVNLLASSFAIFLFNTVYAKTVVETLALCGLESAPMKNRKR